MSFLDLYGEIGLLIFIVRLCIDDYYEGWWLIGAFVFTLMFWPLWLLNLWEMKGYE